MTNDTHAPVVLGRFNFVSFRKNLYNVIFVPYDGSVCVLVAKNLTYEEKEKMQKGMNNILKEMRDSFYEEDDELHSELDKEGEGI